LQQAQTLQILVSSRDQDAGAARRAEAGGGGGKGGVGGAAVEKWARDPDQPRDERGRWTSEDESGA
jgi:hypothetical protein